MNFNFKILYYDPANPKVCLLKNFNGDERQCFATTQKLSYGEAAEVLKKEEWSPALGTMMSGQVIKIMQTETVFRDSIEKFEEIGPLTSSKLQGGIYIRHTEGYIYRLVKTYGASLLVMDLYDRSVCSIIFQDQDHCVAKIENRLFGQLRYMEFRMNYAEFVILKPL